MKKDIPGFEGLYQADENGNIYSVKKKIKLKGNKLHSGYLQYSLRKGNRRFLFLGHRLIAMTFIANPFNYPIINHKDECKENNRVDNLEWCTHSYNTKYSLSTEHMKQLAIIHKEQLSKKVVQKTLNGIVIAYYDSQREAEKITKIHNISGACNKHRKTAGGYIWDFA